MPTSIMIKKLPFKWTTDDLLHFMSQLNLPKPTALNLLYDELQRPRGMAFADFTSADETKRVIQKMNNYRLDGRRLNVQLKRQPSGTVIGENLPQKGESSSRPQAEASVATKPRRETTPPSESYDLLMSYQKHPVEKEKLKKFLEQTGDYQEAVNEFCKNRAQESLAGIYPACLQKGTVVEKTSATPGEEEDLAGLE